MNCPSRNDDIDKHPHWNQTPPALTADLTTREDLSGIANTRELDHVVDPSQSDKEEANFVRNAADKPTHAAQKVEPKQYTSTKSKDSHPRRSCKDFFPELVKRHTTRLLGILVKYARFIGPGFLIAVAYIDPGNYATDVNGKHKSYRYVQCCFHLELIMMLESPMREASC